MERRSSIRHDDCWTWLTALSVEGICLLGLLLGEAAAPLGATLLGGRDPDGFIAPVIAAAFWWLINAPLRLGRFSWYADRRWDGAKSPRPSRSLARFIDGWRLFFPAASWRFRLWCRRTAACILCRIPAWALWIAGTLFSEAARLPWLVLGGVAALAGAVAARLWLVRYAAAPVFLLDGYPAGAALQLSVRVMRRHRGEYLDFLAGWTVRLLLCLLIVPAIWWLPQFGTEQTAFLLRLRDSAAVLPGVTRRKLPVGA